MDGEIAEAFRDASRFFVEAVRHVPPERWDGPGLGDWTLRELVAHANRAHTTVEEYLLRPQEPQPPDGPYFRDEAIAARGREAVRALGADPGRAVEAIAESVLLLIDDSPADRPVCGPAGAMTLEQYLPSRTAELTVHGLDVGRALALELNAPAGAVEASLTFVVRLAARKQLSQRLLLAASGRDPLPTDYSAY